MKKTIRTTLALSALFAVSMPLTQAADIANQFTVSVTLSSQCRAKDDDTKTLDFGTYTAFSASAVDATPIDIEFECTRGLAPSSVAFDATNGTAIGGGVIAGLNYDMEFDTAVVTDGDEATEVAGEIGTADLRSYEITASMAALQAGTDGATDNHTRTLIVSY
ncbi:MAG: spore coat protein U domain-containing protein [Pseudomonadota bacterium]